MGLVRRVERTSKTVMGKRDNRRRREKRRERRAEERARDQGRQVTAPAIPSSARTMAFRARGGVELQLPVTAQTVQGTGAALTADEARARLFEHAFSRTADA